MYSRVEPRYYEVQRDWQNLFAVTRFCDIEVLFHMFYYYWAWGKENRLLYRGLCYVEVCYMEVPPNYFNVCQPVLLVCMQSKGKESPTPPPPPNLSLLLQRGPYRYCLCHLVKKWDWHSWSWMGHLFVMFPGVGYNINFEHTRVTILTEKQVFLERVSLQMQNPFLYK